ncbi:MAG: DegT/DnrJ/EryC1/StrS family aminotransferase [Bacteroidales bacterium]|nr:DegT/DnrJ/EryC1/StrS family aminotransferase [Bacteroidales bacterium]
MDKIVMVDLFGQYRKIRTEIDRAMQQVIESSAFIKGPEVKAFEQELARYMNAKNVISCGNGTDALQISLMALGLKPGDEVITPAFTFGATVEVIALLGMKPVFADVDPGTFNMDLNSLERAITSKTRAIIPVHLFGQCADLDRIMKLAKIHGLYVIEDAAQAISADYRPEGLAIKKAGTIGHIGCTSFFPSKNLGCFGDGGAIFTDDDDLAQDLSAITTHGMYVKYYQDLIGVNSRLDSIQAAVLRVKLRHIDEYAGLRRKAADYYDNTLRDLQGLGLPSRVSYGTHVFHQYTIKLDGIDRTKFRDYLKSKGIPTMIYYPVPLHLQKAFQYLGYRKGDLPVSEMLSESVVSLPMHTELNEEQLEYITGNIIEFIKGNHEK